MSFNPTSPVTGSAITGLTTPTYTLTSDSGPDVNTKQWAVTALGGTQTGVVAHSPQAPFTVSFKKPKVVRSLGFKNQVSGQYTSVPVNEYKMILRKGGQVQSGQYANCIVDCSIRIPAGLETFDGVQVSALASILGGLIAQQIQGIKDTAVTGIA